MGELTTGELEFTDGAYRTPPRQASLVERWFPSLTFHPRLVGSVFRASAAARQGQYGDRQWSDHALYIMRSLESVGVTFDISGIEHLRSLDGPAVVVGNHMSTLETAVLPGIIQPILPVTFVVKQSLIDYPVFKHIMRARRPIAVTQTDPRRDLKTMLAEGASRLAEGISVVVFPEGRRSPAFDARRFNTIGVKLAHRGDVPVVPLALYTNAWALGRGRLSDFGRIDPREKVRFEFGPPMAAEGRGGDANRAVVDFIAERLETWRREDGRAAPPPAAVSAEPYEAGDV